MGRAVTLNAVPALTLWDEASVARGSVADGSAAMAYVIDSLTTFSEQAKVVLPRTDLLRKQREYELTGRQPSTTSGGLVSILRQNSATSSKPRRPVKFNPKVRVRHMKT